MLKMLKHHACRLRVEASCSKYRFHAERSCRDLVLKNNAQNLDIICSKCRNDIVKCRNAHTCSNSELLLCTTMGHRRDSCQDGPGM